ncbi:MAG: phosphomannomutase [Abditibacteriota bacterium]|nr:phosphomannomutase [Abditibacteriota bacterium]
MSQSSHNSSESSPLMVSVSGIRGVVGESLNPIVATEFVLAYAAWLRDQGSARPKVLLARDTRPTGEMIRHATLSALLAGGCQVIDLGIVTTPTLQLAIGHHKADGAICITASHNPVEWNALKFFQPNGMYLDKAQGNVVIAKQAARDFNCNDWSAMGTIESDEAATRRHLDKVLSAVDVEAIRAKNFKVVLDGCCGAGNRISPTLLRELNCTLIHINEDFSGHFPHNPEPLNENLQQLAQAVKEHGADIGFAHDADADRVGICTNEGEPIGEDYSLVWAVAHVLKNRNRGPVVTNLSTTMAVDAVARQFDCEVFRTPVGDINVSGKMHAVGAAIGGEGNGGVIIPDIQFGRDGIAAIALTLEFLAKSDMSSGDLGRTIPRFFNIKSTLQFPRERLDALRMWLKSKEKTARINEDDWLKFEWPKDGDTTSWVHVRPSGTEPFVRVICEAQTQAEAQRIQKTMRAEIESVATAWED